MNIVFWLLIILAVVFAWFVLAFLFKPLGKFFARLYTDAMDEMKVEETEENEQNENQN